MRIAMILGALAIAATAVAFYPVGDEDGVHELSARVARLEQSLSEQERRCDDAVAEIERELRGAKAAPSARPSDAPAATVASTPPTAPPQTPAAVEPPIDPRTAPPPPSIDVQERFSALFDHESTDPTWARTTEDELEEKLEAQLPPASTVQSVECRASLCRVETVHRDPSAWSAVMSAGKDDPDNALWTGDVFSEELPSATGQESVVVSYFARQGTALPSFNH